MKFSIEDKLRMLVILFSSTTREEQGSRFSENVSFSFEFIAK